MKYKMLDLNEYAKLFKRQGILRKIISVSIKLIIVMVMLSVVFYLVSIPRPKIDSYETKEFSYEGTKNIENFVFDKDTGKFHIVTDSGSIWKSESDSKEAEEDEIAKGINRIMMQSQLAIRYSDKDSRVYIATSLVNALSGGEKSLGAEIDGKKVTATYNFLTGKESEGLYISIPIEYEFNDDSLKVSILTDKIKENEEYRLIEISLLPYLGAADRDDEGYIFIPDGSGALIDFNDSKTYAQEWFEYIYGRDPSLEVNVQTGVKEMVRLPVFGIKKEESAFLAIVEEGDSLCSITVNTQGYNSSKSLAYFSYRFREFDTIVLSEMGWNERRIPYVGETANSNRPFTVRYIFLDGNEANYSAMALTHRNYLMQKYNIKSSKKTEKFPFLADVYMSIRRVRPVLGLPKDTTTALTTFDEISGMIENFKENGIEDIALKLNGWTKGGPFYKPADKVSFERSIGGYNGFRKLADEFRNDESVNFFPSTDTVNGYENGNKFISILQGNRNITGALSLQNKFLMSTGRRNPRHKSWNLITPGFSYGLINEFLNSYDKITSSGVDGIGLDEYGEMLYSDNYDSVLNKLVSRVPMDRQSVLYLWQDIMSRSAQSAGSLMVTGGNQYAIPFADYIIGVPMNSSSLNISTKDVPYYQILVSGILNMASSPVNFSHDTDEFYLKCLETGTLPLYSFFARESSMVKNTRLNYLYNGEYSLWLDLAASKYSEFNDAYLKIGNSGILNHKSENNISTTEFENGIIVEINYNEKTFKLFEGGKS